MIRKKCLDVGIEWKPIPSNSLHFDALWKIMVKVAMLRFYVIAGLSRSTVDELHTLVCQISAFLNSKLVTGTNTGFFLEQSELIDINMSV